MSLQKFVSQLEERLAALDQERQHIEGLLKLYRDPAQTVLPLEPSNLPAANGRSGANGRAPHVGFVADPNSRTSQILEHARSLVDRMQGKAEMREVIRRLPTEFTRTPKDKAYVRTTLHRAGKRVGLEFVGAGLLVLR